MRGCLPISSVTSASQNCAGGSVAKHFTNATALGSGHYLSPGEGGGGSVGGSLDFQENKREDQS